MSSKTVLFSGLGTLAVALGYILIKRFRRSRCQSHTSCCDCDSPEIKLHQENTTRLDTIMQFINELKPKLADPVSPILLSIKEPVIGVTATSVDSRACDNRPDNLTCPPPPERIGSHDNV